MSFTDQETYVNNKGNIRMKVHSTIGQAARRRPVNRNINKTTKTKNIKGKRYTMNSMGRIVSVSNIKPKRSISNRVKNTVKKVLPPIGGSKKKARKPKVHKGPRGGKYIMRKGKKVYI